MSQRTPTSRRPQQGFTLIELMVGVVLGMLAIVAIAQVMVMSEGSKRSITGGADAQISGALGLFALERELGMSGYGFSAIPASLGCKVNYKVDTLPAAHFTLAPVIIGAGDDGSNTITVLRSTKTSFSVPMLVNAEHTSANTDFTVESAFGATVGDLLVAMPLDIAVTECQIFQVSGSPVNNKIPHAVSSTSPWNAGGASAGTFPINSYLFNMGALSMQEFSVNKLTRSLQVRQLTSLGTVGDAQDVQPQVVMLKALYGKATVGATVVDTYDTDTPTTNAGWAQVRSIRVLIVARSAQPARTDEADPTPATLEWDVGTDTVAGSAKCQTNDRKCISIDLSPLGTDYRRYRYKLYDTVIPLRNMLWKAE